VGDSTVEGRGEADARCKDVKKSRSQGHCQTGSGENQSLARLHKTKSREMGCDDQRIAKAAWESSEKRSSNEPVDAVLEGTDRYTGLSRERPTELMKGKGRELVVDVSEGRINRITALEGGPFVSEIGKRPRQNGSGNSSEREAEKPRRPEK